MNQHRGTPEQLVEQLVTYTLEVDGQLVVIEHFPARVNEGTGESFFSPETVERIQGIVWGAANATSDHGGARFRIRCIVPPMSIQLSLEERLQLVEDLWDSIASEAESRPDSLPLIEAQRHEIRRRSTAHRADPDAALPLDEALERIESDQT